MEYKLAITDFFEAIENNDENVAKKLCVDVQHELEILEKLSGLNASAKTHIKRVAELKENVLIGKIKLARGKLTTIKAGFNGQLKNALQEYKQKQQRAAACGNKNYPKEPQADYDQPPNNHYPKQDTYGHAGQGEVRSSDVSAPQENMIYPDRRKPVVSVDEETEKMKKSQRASQAMRHNNPDIADLSDTNRPTKIAERFSEFYDNEWTEAFDILSNKKKTEEKKITKLLLQIVQEAYRFCKQEAEQEITAMHSAIIDILEFGEIKGKVNKDKLMDTSLLVQYRKENASKAVNRLQKEFFKKKLNPICTGAIRDEPAKNGVMAKYGDRAVELTWWMCVQDPPVHMVSTEASFNPDFYRAYTKSGKYPDFFVWPALRLHERGSIMTKGVVQYK